MSKNIDVEEAKERIEKAIRQNGPFSHNIVGLALSSVADKHGNETANKLIEEYGLDGLYGIQKVIK